MNIKTLKLMEQNLKNYFGYDYPLHQIYAGDTKPYVEWNTLTIDDLNEVERQFLESEVNINLIEVVKNPKDNPLLVKEFDIEGDKVKLICQYKKPNWKDKKPYIILGKRPFRKVSKKEKQNKIIEEFECKCLKIAEKVKNNYDKFLDIMSFLTEVRHSLLVNEKLGYTEEDFIKAITLYIKFKNSDNKINFLKNNNFKGIENFGIDKRVSDGFGHHRVTTYDIDFYNKEVIVKTGSSDD